MGKCGWENTDGNMQMGKCGVEGVEGYKLRLDIVYSHDKEFTHFKLTTTLKVN